MDLELSTATGDLEIGIKSGLVCFIETVRSC